MRALLNVDCSQHNRRQLCSVRQSLIALLEELMGQARDILSLRLRGEGAF